MTIWFHTLFEEHYVGVDPIDLTGLPGRDKPEFIYVEDLEVEIAKQLADGLCVIGKSEFPCRANFALDGPSTNQATKVGADVVLVRAFLSKFNAIKRLPNGSIDIALAKANPPAAIRPSGYAVVTAIFMRRSRERLPRDSA